MKQFLLNIKGEIYSNTVTVGDFNIPSTSIDRFYRQKINKETVALSDALDYMDLIDVFRAFSPKEYAFFANVHGTFCSINYMSGHKSSLSINF